MATSNGERRKRGDESGLDVRGVVRRIGVDVLG
jgi:hypothetical protein